MGIHQVRCPNTSCQVSGYIQSGVLIHLVRYLDTSSHVSKYIMSGVWIHPIRCLNTSCQVSGYIKSAGESDWTFHFVPDHWFKQLYLGQLKHNKDTLNCVKCARMRRTIHRTMTEEERQ